MFFPFRHHIYELILRCVFECKVRDVTNSADILLFKHFRERWENVNTNNFQNGKKDVEVFFNESEIKEMLDFYESELDKPTLRGDYCELIELSEIFFGGDSEKKRPPGAMHQARWIARAIHCKEQKCIKF